MSDHRAGSTSAPEHAAGARFLAEPDDSGYAGERYLPARAAVLGHGTRFLLDDADAPSQDASIDTDHLTSPARAQLVTGLLPDDSVPAWMPARVLEPPHASAQPAQPTGLASPRNPSSRRITPKTLVSTLSVVAVVGSLACFGISSRAVATSGISFGTSARGVLHSSAAPAAASSSDGGAVATSAAASSVSPRDLAQASEIATSSATSIATQSQTSAATASSSSTSASPLSVDGSTAPGQKQALSVTDALAKAKSMVGNEDYGDMCLALVAAFYGYTSSGETGAQQAAGQITTAGQMHTDMSNLSAIPLGALIWYSGSSVGNPYGHVAMYAGDGKVYSNGAGPNGAVGLVSIDTPVKSWGEPYIGWSGVWLPNATK